ncbi:SpoIIE family protein phosphatase [Heliobacillus mobilis]|uniref:SpoIIE family protein phosphatase n=2 Tax=Heliobacterium mobile TaxID=28064 RepID=A0A6I3SI43_HELMO|nr:SpoIIE family protein phosphatase [Heliobacterium mobile]MTV48500.1 SpoIIE family protein phosphatase [Heliobacterium mobile]
MWEEPTVYPFRRERVPDSKKASKQERKTKKVGSSKGRTQGNAVRSFAAMVSLARSVQQVYHRVGGVTLGVHKQLQKVLAELKEPTQWVWWIVFFLLARGTLLGGLAVAAPAALAVIAARRPERLNWSLSAAFAGWLSLRASWSYPLGIPDDPLGLHPIAQLTAWMVAAMGSVALIRKRQWPPVVLAGLTAASLWTVEGFTMAWLTPSLYGGILVAFEGLFAAVATIIFSTVEKAMQGKAGDRLNQEELTCITVMGLLILLGIPLEPIYGLSLQTIAANIILLFSAYLFGAGGGAVGGIAVGLLPSLTSFGAPSSMALFALSGLLAGVFRPWAKPGVLGGFFLGHLLLSIYMGGSREVHQALFEATVAGTVLFFWPVSWLQVLRRRITKRDAAANAALELENNRKKLAGKLEEMGRMFGQLAVTFDEVSQPVSPNPEKMREPLYGAIEERVCKLCSSYGLCWERDAERTRQYLEELFNHIEEKGMVSSKELTPQLARRCARLGELAAAISSLLESIAIDRYWRRRLQEGRGLVGAQFRGLAGWMASLVRELESTRSPEKIIEHLSKALQERGFRLNKANIFDEDEDWQLDVEGPGCSGSWPCAEYAAAIVADMLGKPIMVGKTDCHSTAACYFGLFPAQPYRLNVAVAQTPRYGSAVAGDSTGYWDGPGGRKVVALSDGSGVGPRAARESASTLSMLEHLCRVGIFPGEALHSVNSLVALATEEESFATVDMAVIDVSTAEAEIFKLGASPSYLKRGQRVQIVQNSSLPLGILKNLEVESINLSLLPGDRLILVSDGIFDARRELNSQDWLIPLLEQLTLDDAKELAQRILQEALQHNDGKAKDDATVVVIDLQGRRGSFEGSGKTV